MQFIANTPRLDYAITIAKPGTFTLQLHLLPTHPLAGTLPRLAVALESGQKTSRLDS